MNCDKKMTIMICSCDNYEDLWNPFFKLFKKYWENCPYKILLNTETKNYMFNGNNIKTKNTNYKKYGKRMIEGLKNVDSELVMILLDDFFIRRKVDNNEIKQIIEIMNKDKEITCFSFKGINKWCKKSEEYPKYFQMNKICPYKLSMQAAIWRTNDLLNLWKDDDDPWRWELLVNYLSFNDKNKYLTIKDTKSSPIYYGFNKDGMGVFRGKWVIEDVKPLFEKEEIDVDFLKRGVYEKSKTKNEYSPSIDLLFYSIKRIGIITTTKIIFYEYIVRRICKKYSNYNYTEYISSRYMRKC